MPISIITCENRHFKIEATPDFFENPASALKEWCQEQSKHLPPNLISDFKLRITSDRPRGRSHRLSYIFREHCVLTEIPDTQNPQNFEQSLMLRDEILNVLKQAESLSFKETSLSPSIQKALKEKYEAKQKYLNSINALEANIESSRKRISEMLFFPFYLALWTIIFI